MRKKMALLLALLLPVSLLPQNPRVSSWLRSFYIDEKLDQNHLRAIASFISYLMQKQASEESFNEEYTEIRNAFTLPKYVNQSLVRLFSNSLAQATKMGSVPDQPNEEIWRMSLMEYYQEVQPLLDREHQTYGYGKQKGQPLPAPPKK